MQYLKGLTEAEILSQLCSRCSGRVHVTRGKYTAGLPGRPFIGSCISVVNCARCETTRWGEFTFDRKTSACSAVEKFLLNLDLTPLEIHEPSESPAAPLPVSDLDSFMRVSEKVNRVLDQLTEISAQADNIVSAPAPLPVAPIVAPPIKILIGDLPDATQAFWEPAQEKNPLNNFSILVTGDSGCGKSQLIRAFLSELRVPVWIFDFKNDYSGDFATRHGFKVYDLNKQGLPFNPLHLLENEDGECQPIRQIHEIAGVLRRIFTLGDQQEARLKNGIVEAFIKRGIDPRFVYKRIKASGKTPSFSEVYELLKLNTENQSLLNRLSYLFDLGLFPGEQRIVFTDLLRQPTVFSFHKLPDDRMKGLLAEFLIIRLHAQMLKQPHVLHLGFQLVLDEAWRIKESERLQELAREGRAFGLGLIVGTQFPGDLPEALTGNLATQIFLHNKEPEHQRFIIKSLLGSASGAEFSALMEEMGRCQKHQGFLKNQQYAPFASVKTLPYYARHSS